jgi:5-methylcytosine-specific restriction protein A
MTRLEFPRKIKSAAFARSGGKCEACSLPFKGGAQYDHVLPAALGGEPTLANCRALCVACHAEKTAADVKRIRKADRQRDRANGSIAPKSKIKSAGFPKAPARDPKRRLPPRSLYT